MDANNTPATKADVAELKAEFKHDLAEVRQDIAAMAERMKVHGENIETKLLKAFHGWAQSH